MFCGSPCCCSAKLVSSASRSLSSISAFREFTGLSWPPSSVTTNHLVSHLVIRAAGEERRHPRAAAADCPAAPHRASLRRSWRHTQHLALLLTNKSCDTYCLAEILTPTETLIPFSQLLRTLSHPATAAAATAVSPCCRPFAACTAGCSLGQ